MRGNPRGPFVRGPTRRDEAPRPRRITVRPRVRDPRRRATKTQHRVASYHIDRAPDQRGRIRGLCDDLPFPATARRAAPHFVRRGYARAIRAFTLTDRIA